MKTRKFLTVILIGFLGYFLFTNVSDLMRIRDQVNPIALSLAIFLAILAILLSAYKFKLTVELSLNKTILFKSWIGVFVKGYLINYLIPYSGVAYRGVQLKKYHDVSYTEYVGICYLFGMVGLILLLVSVALFLSFHLQTIVFITLLAALFLLIKFKFYFYRKIANLNYKKHT
jgi:hypothetical protein